MTTTWKITFRLLYAVAGMAFFILATASVSFGQEFWYNGSLQFASGEYIFSQRTNSLYLLNGISVSSGPLQASGSIPLIIQSTPWVSYSGGGMIPSGGGQHSEVSHRGGGRKIAIPDTTDYDQMGLGDPLIYAGVELWKEQEIVPSLRLIASLKAPLADVDKGFGTGEWDYGGGVSVTRTMGHIYLFADAVYWVLGDLPDLELNDPLAYNIAFGWSLDNGKYSLLTSFSGYTRILNDTEPPIQVGIGLNWQMDPTRSLIGSISFGITESAPDFAVSFGWGIGI